MEPGTLQLRVLVITLRFHPSIGGVETNSYEISRRLILRGHEVTVLTSNIIGVNPRSSVPAGVYNISGIKVVRYNNIFPRFVPNSMGYVMPKAFFNLNNMYHEYDIIHSHGYGFFPAWGALPIVYKKKIKWVISAHTATESNLPRGIYDGIIGKLILRRADAIICMTKAEFDFFKHLGKSVNQLRIIPAGVDLPHSDLKPSKEITKCLSSVRRYILYVGRISKNKGIDILIKASKKFLEMQSDLYLVIAGEDNGYEVYIRGLVKTMNLDRKVKFVGRFEESDKYYLYKNALFIIAPSLYGEAQNISATQAIAYGKSVIVSSIGGLRETFKNYQRAILVKPGNIEELSRAIEQMLVESIGVDETPRERDGSTFRTWDEVTTDVEYLYKNL